MAHTKNSPESSNYTGAMSKAEKQIRRTVAEHNLIEDGDHIVLGLSGGPDSMCLFDVLLDMAKEMSLTIHPVHVNHKFRPGAAEQDQKFVEDICARNGLQCYSVTVDCNALADRLGMTSEEAGRKARYDAFYNAACRAAGEIAKGNDQGGKTAFARVKIAVAQNADDQAETVLLRLLRGTGTDGLAGIAYERLERGPAGQEKSPERETGASQTFKVIRPLLDTWRRDIEQHCEERELEPVIDHTNNEELYSRNRIRLDLIPYLESKYNENIKSGLVRLARISADDKDYFWNETEQKIEELRVKADVANEPAATDNTGVIVLDRAGLAGCHPSIRHRIVMKSFGMIGLENDITAERLKAADAIICRKQGEKKVEFPHGYLLTVARGKVILSGVQGI